MSLITRYVLRLYITAIAVSLVAFVSIFFVVDLIEQLDRFLDREVAPVYIALYYVYYTPYIFVLTIPVSLLLASLYTFGQLTRLGELTAMKASGLSLYRLLRPMLLVSAVVSGCLFWAGEWLVPHTSMKRAEIQSEHVDIQDGAGQHVRNDVYFRGEGGRQFYIRVFDGHEAKGTGVFVTEFRDSLVSSVLSAESAVWNDGRWLLSNGEERRFRTGGGLSEYITFAEREPDGWSETPEDFMRGQKRPEEMSYGELDELIQNVRLGGGDVQGYLVDLNLKIAFPSAGLIIVLLGGALASHLRRGGVAVGFALSIGICFVYWGLLRFAQAFGHAGLLHPMAAAWGANALFCLLALILLVRAPK